jgi:hypothetical protein
MRLQATIVIAMGILMASLPILIRVSQSGQSPTASFAYSPSISGPGDIIAFDASASYAPGGSIVSYTWDFGDGVIATTSNPIITHSYPLDGNYTVQLTVTDDSGLIGIAVAVIQVQKDVNFRVCIANTVIPLANVQVTVYYNNGKAWVPVPARSADPGVYVEYDNMTQPRETIQYRNPGFTASILLNNATNIELDIHPSSMIVFFKIQWGSQIAYWPNNADTYYTYDKHTGTAVAQSFGCGGKPQWDPTAQTYVINALYIKSAKCGEGAPIVAGILCPPPNPQYSLTVKTDPLGITTIPGQGLYTNGTSVVLAAPAYVNVSTSMQYRFNYWDVDGISRGSGVNPITVLMTANHTATAHYVTQYYLTVSSARGAPTPVSGWFDSGTGITASVTSPAVGPSGTQYVCTGWTGTGSVPSSGSGATVTFNITQPSNITWNWKTQYQVIFDQTGVCSDFSGTIVTIDGVNYSRSGLPTTPQFWWDQGSSHNFSFASPLPVNGGKNYIWNSTGGLSSLQSGTLTITTSGNVIGNYIVQNQITFDQTGVCSDFNGTIVIIDGVNYTGSQLPISFAWTNGSLHTFAYQSPLIPSANTKYVWNSTTGLTNLQSDPITITTYGSIIGNYKAQYYLTVSSVYGSTGGQGWYDSGSTAYGTVDPLTVAGPSGTQYVFTTWSGDASGSTSPSNAIAMSGPKTATANWKTQYYLTVSSAHGVVGGEGWYDSGSSAYATVTPLIVSGSSGTQYVFTQWSGDASGNTSPSDPIVMSGPMTATANWKTQYYLTVSSVYGTVGGQGWYDSGATAYATVTPLTIAGPRGTQYAFDYWSGEVSGTTSPSDPIVMSGPMTATANWKTQYYLTVSSAHGVVGGEGWYDDGSTAYATVAPLTVSGGSGVQYVFTVWSGGASGNTSPSNVITMNGPKTATANWKTQYYLTLATDPMGVASPSGAEWYDAGSNATISTPAFVDIVPDPSRYRFNGWATSQITEIEDPLRSPTNVSMDEAKTVTANYVVQYQVTFKQADVGSDFQDIVVRVDLNQYNITSLPATFWWDDGTTHSFTYESPLIVAPDTRYVWNGTTGLSTLQTDSITVSNSGEVTGNYKKQYFLTVSSQYDSPTPYSGWISADASTTASVTSPWPGATGTRYVCTGWNGTGSVPTLGTDSTVVFTMTQPSNITWTWKTQYLLTVTTYPAGLGSQPTRNPTGDAGPANAWWYDNATDVDLTAQTNSGYTFSYWNVDGIPQGTANSITVTMTETHSATANYASPLAPLGVSINPLSDTIYVGQSLTFTSAVSGGTEPYNYQWYLNSNPVGGATSNSWVFTPTSGTIYYVYLKVKDSNNNNAQSDTARIEVISPPPVGGLSDKVISRSNNTPTVGITAYSALMAMFAAGLGLRKRKRK